jgi:hypothetical protein
MFLVGKSFLLRTDHAALAKLLRRDLPPTSRVERWILRLSEYVFSIEHQPGKENIIADVLSRLPFASAAPEQSPVTSAQTDTTSVQERNAIRNENLEEGSEHHARGS